MMHPRFIADYEDGSEDMFAVPECTLGQGDVFTASPWFGPFCGDLF